MSGGFHGIVAGEGVHFGLGLWPYDLLLRFGYDLPENEHTWAAKWFDDVFEAASLDIRSSAAKLMLSLRDVGAASADVQAAAEGGSRPAELTWCASLARSAPMKVDLSAGYLRRLAEDLAAVIPGCFGQDGRSLLEARGSLEALASCPALATLDAPLASLVDAGAQLLSPLKQLRAHSPELYVITGTRYVGSLPRAGARFIRESCRITLAGIAELAAVTNQLAHWLDDLLEHLQRVVARLSEPGPELLERWAVRDWSLLMMADEGDGSLGSFLPSLGA